MDGGLSKYETYQPTTFPWSVLLSIASFLSIFISFVSPYWLANDLQTDDHPFLNLGLWQACFSSYEDYRFLYDRVYDGCYWTLAEEMHVIEDQMRRPFYIAVQTLFSFTFILSILSAISTGLLIACPGEEQEKGLVKFTFIDNVLGFIFGFMAVIIFAVFGDARDWMPQWDHNFLSWAFALAVVGVILQFITALLFWVEYRIIKRGEQFRSSHGMIPMDTKA